VSYIGARKQGETYPWISRAYNTPLFTDHFGATHLVWKSLPYGAKLRCPCYLRKQPQSKNVSFIQIRARGTVPAVTSARKTATAWFCICQLIKSLLLKGQAQNSLTFMVKGW
jgi:hypothetical protein